MTSFDILERFRKNHPDIVEAMMNANHNYSLNVISPYHAEGSVWTHTMMVFKYAALKGFSDEVKFAALFHDIGKAFTCVRNNEKKRVSFFGHDGVSFYRCIDIMRNTYSDVLTEKQIRFIAKLVACHSSLYSWKVKGECYDFQDDHVFYYKLLELVESDVRGRISIESGIPLPIDPGYAPVELKPSRLTVLIGPPGCGKSTWVKENQGDAVVISSDEIIMETTEGRNYNEKWKNADMVQVERSMGAMFTQAVRERKNIIIDRTNMSKKSRRRFTSQVPVGYYKEAVVFFTGHEELISRNEARVGKRISDSVIHSMEKNFAYPLYSEFDFIHQVY